MHVRVELLAEAPFVGPYADALRFLPRPSLMSWLATHHSGIRGWYLRQTAKDIRRHLCDSCPIPHRGQQPYQNVYSHVSPGEIIGAVYTGCQCTGPVFCKDVEEGSRLFAVAPWFYFRHPKTHQTACVGRE